MITAEFKKYLLAEMERLNAAGFFDDEKSYQCAVNNINSVEEDASPPEDAFTDLVRRSQEKLDEERNGRSGSVLGDHDDGSSAGPDRDK